MFHLINSIIDRIALKFCYCNSWEEYWKTHTDGQDFGDSKDATIILLLIFTVACVVGDGIIISIATGQFFK